MTNELSNPDTRVEVPIELTNDEWFQMMKLAHERDITLNKFVEEILTEAIKLAEADKSNPTD